MAIDPRAPSAVAQPRVYCTYFDRNYLPRGLALWRSLRRVSPHAMLWIGCLDEATRRTLEELALTGVHLFSLGELEQHFPDLAAIRSTRSRVEYYFTCTPAVVRYVLDTAADIDQVTYLDADLFFFADPEPLFEEIAKAGGAVGIVPHRFSERLKEYESHGIFNVGWITFTRDDRGLSCLEDWRLKCIEWCYDREENGRFADQKYLDEWPTRFPGVVVLSHLGANVALWNLERWKITKGDKAILINGSPLLFYHFHGVTTLAPWLFHTYAAAFGLRLSREVRRLIYIPYLRAWRDVLTEVEPIPQPLPGRTRAATSIRGLVWNIFRSRKEALTMLQAVIGRSGEYMVVLGKGKRPRDRAQLSHDVSRASAESS